MAQNEIVKPDHNLFNLSAFLMEKKTVSEYIN